MRFRVPTILFTALFFAAGLSSCSKREFAELPVSDSGPEAQESSAAVDTGDSSSPGAPAHSVEDNWFLITEVDGDWDYKVYVDISTIDTVDGEIVSWSKLVFDEDHTDSDGLVYREVRIASSIDCKQRTYMYRSSKFYDGLGKLVYQEDIETDRAPIPGGTVSAHIADFVCGYEPPRGNGAGR